MRGLPLAPGASTLTGVPRITLTFAALARARAIFVLATGDAKAGALHRVIDLRDQALPATRLGTDTVEPSWFVDSSAAAQLD